MDLLSGGVVEVGGSSRIEILVFLLFLLFYYLHIFLVTLRLVTLDRSIIEGLVVETDFINSVRIGGMEYSRLVFGNGVAGDGRVLMKWRLTTGDEAS